MSSPSSLPPSSPPEADDKNSVEGEEKTVSKKAAKKAEKEALKAAKKAEKQELLEAAQNALNKKANDEEIDTYGFLPRIQSARRGKRVWTEVRDIDEKLSKQKIWVRGRLQDSKGKGSVCFVTLRHQLSTIQAVLEVNRGLAKDMIKWAAALPWESVVDIYGEVEIPEKKFEGTTQPVELKVDKMFCVSKAAPELPFQFRDVNRREEEGEEKEEKKEVQTEEDKEKSEEGKALVRVNQDTRLDNRVIDLRVPVNLAIFRIQSATCQHFRDFLLKENFIEIHSPKLIAGASEGGANVFTLKYFGRDACLAQSPQLYKQMAISGDMERVFEIGPVFRAENSNTYRHMCEFVGLDMEMSFKEHYFEVLEFIDVMFQAIFEGINKNCKRELAEVQRIYPFEPFSWLPKMPKIEFADAIQMLRDAGASNIPDDISEFDLSTELEKRLGKIVKEKYNTDFYAVIRYPRKVRPFYSMPSPDDDKFSNTYDVFMRGEEILSGAQRVHDADLLEQQAKNSGIDVRTIQSYIDAFKYGALPHAGCGVGLERVVMLFLGLNNIRKAALFPRDPKRLTP